MYIINYLKTELLSFILKMFSKNKRSLIFTDIKTHS